MIEILVDEKARSCYICVDRTRTDDVEDTVGRTEVLAEEAGFFIGADWRKDGSLYGVEVILPSEPTKADDEGYAIP